MTTRAMRIMTHDGAMYDSVLELAWQRELDSMKIRNAHHFEHLDLGGRGWWEPDFTLWDNDGNKYWLEVKGPHRERMWKFEVAASLWPNRVILGLGEIVLKDADEPGELDRPFYYLSWHPPTGQEIPQLGLWDGTTEALKAPARSWERLLAEGGSLGGWPIRKLQASGTVVS